jgi:hypothetical protein
MLIKHIKLRLLTKPQGKQEIVDTEGRVKKTSGILEVNLQNAQ